MILGCQRRGPQQNSELKRNGSDNGSQLEGRQDADEAGDISIPGIWHKLDDGGC